jgi:DnaJ domain
LPEIVFVLVLILLVGGLWLFRALDPKVLARAIRYAAVAALAVLAILLAISGRAFLDLPIGALIFLLLRGWFARGFPGISRLKAWLDGKPHQAGTSAIETKWLRMTLDRATGMLDGEVVAGRFQGAHLNQLGLGQLRALLAECEADDAQSARLVETYLDRVHPDWRAEQNDAAEPPSAGSPMTQAEAWQILGLEPGTDPEAIRAAHRKLMMKLHPDHGGSTYLARQINAARDVLLGG